MNLNLPHRAAVVERLLAELGNPPIVAVSMWNERTDLQLKRIHPQIDWREVKPGKHWQADIEREELPIHLSVYLTEVAA